MKAFKNLIGGAAFALLLFVITITSKVAAQEEPITQPPPNENAQSEQIPKPDTPPQTQAAPATEVQKSKEATPPAKKAKQAPTAKRNTEENTQSKPKSENENVLNIPKNSQEESKKDSASQFNLPDVATEEISKNPEQNSTVPTVQSRKNLWATIVSWVLMAAGLILILKSVSSNLKIPRNFEPHVRSRHGTKLKKFKKKYK